MPSSEERNTCGGNQCPDDMIVAVPVNYTPAFMPTGI